MFNIFNKKQAEQKCIESKEEFIEYPYFNAYLIKSCFIEWILNMYKKSNKKYADMRHDNSIESIINITDDTYIKIENFHNADKTIRAYWNYYVIYYITVYIHGIKALGMHVGYKKDGKIEKFLENDMVDGYDSVLNMYWQNDGFEIFTYACYYDIPNWFRLEVKNIFNRTLGLLQNSGSYNQNKINQKIYVEKDEKKQVCFLLYKYLEEYLSDEEVKSLSENAKVACFKILKEYISPILNNELTSEEIEKNLDDVTKKLNLIEMKE